jgi:RNA polymerase sigma-32 factor
MRSLAKKPKRAGDGQPSLLHRYLRDIGRHSLISAEEERSLAQAFGREGKADAFQKLVTAHLRLVVKIAKEYQRHHAHLLDLVQEGNLGLIEGVRRFDVSKGVKLSSYAGWWIRAYILRFLMENVRVVRVARSREDRKRFYKGELPPPDASLDEMSGFVEGLALQGGASPGDLRPDVAVEQQDTVAYVGRALESFGRALKARDSTVFSERILAEQPAPLRELGDRLSLSGERVRQIEKRLVSRFRNIVQGPLAA